MFERFTERARKVVVLAQEEAKRLGHNYIGTEHLLLGLIKEKEGVAARALHTANVTLDGARDQVESIVGYGEDYTGNQMPFTPRSKKILEFSLKEALQLRHNYIGTEHILLGLVRESEGVAALALSNLGVDPNEVRRNVLDLLGVAKTDTHRPEPPPPSFLAKMRHETLRRLGRTGPEEPEGFRVLVAPFEAQSGALEVSLECAYSLPEYTASGYINHEGLHAGVKRVFDREDSSPVEALIVEAAEFVFGSFDEVREVTINVTVKREPEITVARTFYR